MKLHVVEFQAFKNYFNFSLSDAVDFVCNYPQYQCVSF